MSTGILAGKGAVVPGGSQGIGEAIADADVSLGMTAS